MSGIVAAAVVGLAVSTVACSDEVREDPASGTGTAEEIGTDGSGLEAGREVGSGSAAVGSDGAAAGSGGPAAGSDGAVSGSDGSVPEAGEDPDTEATGGFSFEGPELDALPPAPESDTLLQETERDWAIARGTLEWAWAQDLDALPIGEVAAILGTTFVGTPYAPGTLELQGPERLVVNLRVFDCVTFIEHVLVLSRLTLAAAPELLDDEEDFRTRYREELTRVRYRDGVLAGYPSRLHYFSEWLHNAEEKGLVRVVTRELGGVEDTRAIRFMSSNPEAYRQLAEDPGLVDSIQATEGRLNTVPRYFIPEGEIAAHEEGVRNGDVIAAVSSVDGLDVAHTGLALWRDGRLHLMHAPLVGDSVEISERPLSERIVEIGGQTGVMVARPLPPS